jgi:hypothetical protein
MNGVEWRTLKNVPNKSLAKLKKHFNRENILFMTTFNLIIIPYIKIDSQCIIGLNVSL